MYLLLHDDILASKANTFLHSINLFIYSDVGMIMMQTGMVKQGLNSASHTYIDGMNKRIRKHLLLASFAKKI